MRITTPLAAPPAGAPQPSELPALVGYARSLVEQAHAKVQTPAKFMLEDARDYLEVLPLVLNRAVAVEGIDRGVWWALQGTRLLAGTAHVKTTHLLANADKSIPERRVLHQALLAQMDLVLERVKNAEQLVRRPWPS